MVEALFALVTRNKKTFIIFAGAFMVLDAMLFGSIARAAYARDSLTLNFLNVGQGDAELVGLPGGATLLIDGGPARGNVLHALAEVLPVTQRTIDLVALTHAQADHFAGLIEVLSRYRVGAFLWTGRAGTGVAYEALMHALQEHHVLLVVLRRGDVVRSGKGIVRVVSPDAALAASRDLNDTSLVLQAEFASTTTLFTGDIGKSAERSIANALRAPVSILKVPHHGSKGSVSAAFTDVLRPALAVVEVGKNSYGHPSPEALADLARVGARVFRTDEDGTITVRIDEAGRAHITK